MQRLKLMTMPNCSRSMPKAFNSGSRIGVIITTAALASISIPMIRNRMFSSSRMTTGLFVMELKKETSCWGRPEVVIT